MTKFAMRWLASGAILFALLLAGCSLFQSPDEPSPAPTNTPTATPTNMPTPEPTATPTTAPTHTPTPEPAGTPAATPPPGFFRIPLDINSPWREAFDAFNASEQTCIRDDLGEELLASVLDRPILTGGTAEQWEVVVGECLDPETAVSLVISWSIADTEANAPDLAEVWESCLWQSLSGDEVAALAASLITQVAPDASPASTILADEFFDRVLECSSDMASPPEVTSRPAPVPTQEEFISVSAGGWGHHTCGVTTDGMVTCWGNDERGQSTPPSGEFTSVSAGGLHTCGVRTDGPVECWGNDGEGQSRPPSGEFASVSAGAAHTCGVRRDGPVECWGNDEWGQSTPEPTAITPGPTPGPTGTVESTPTSVQSPINTFTSVSAWGLHTCGVRTDGSVKCWGSDWEGQSTPPSGEFISVSAGGYHTCGVRTDGSVECWGSNDDFNGNEVGQARPPSGEFASVSAGGIHTCGVRTDGSVECWGNDKEGQSTPPSGGFASVSAGGYHTCGVRTDGSVECWGFDESGQSTPPTATPTPEPTATPTTALTHTPTPEPAGTPAATPPPGFFRIPLDINSPWREAFDAFSASEQTCIRDELGEELLASVREQPVLAGDIEVLLRIVRCLGPESTISLRFSVMSAQTAASSPDLVGPTEACLWQTLAGTDVAALAASFIAEIAPDASPGSTTLADEFFDRLLECVSDVASLPVMGSSFPGPSPPDESLIWHYNTGNPGDLIIVSPTLDSGAVYAGTYTGRTYALDANTGELLWSFDIERGGSIPPPLAADGTVYVKNKGGLFVLDASTGELLSSVPGRAAVSDGTITILAASTIAFLSSDVTVSAVDPASGEQLWATSVQRRTEVPIAPVPTAAGGNVYVSDERQVHALDASTGEPIWTFDAGEHLSPPTASDGLVYLQSDVTAYALDESTGEQRWSYDGEMLYSYFADGSVATSAIPPTVIDGVWYLTDNGSLHALDAATGQALWSFEEEYVTRTHLVAEGKVFVNGDAGSFHALDAATGDRMWSLTGTWELYSVLVVDGVVYGASQNGLLHTLDAGTGEPIWSIATGYVPSGPDSQLRDTFAVSGGLLYVGYSDSEGAGVYAFSTPHSD